MRSEWQRHVLQHWHAQVLYTAPGQAVRAAQQQKHSTMLRVLHAWASHVIVSKATAQASFSSYQSNPDPGSPVALGALHLPDGVAATSPYTQSYSAITPGQQLMQYCRTPQSSHTTDSDARYAGGQQPQVCAAMLQPPDVAFDAADEAQLSMWDVSPQLDSIPEHGQSQSVTASQRTVSQRSDSSVSCSAHSTGTAAASTAIETAASELSPASCSKQQRSPSQGGVLGEISNTHSAATLASSAGSASTPKCAAAPPKQLRRETAGFAHSGVDLSPPQLPVPSGLFPVSPDPSPSLPATLPHWLHGKRSIPLALPPPANVRDEAAASAAEATDLSLNPAQLSAAVVLWERQICKSALHCWHAHVQAEKMSRALDLPLSAQVRLPRGVLPDLHTCACSLHSPLL